MHPLRCNPDSGQRSKSRGIARMLYALRIQDGVAGLWRLCWERSFPEYLQGLAQRWSITARKGNNKRRRKGRTSGQKYQGCYLKIAVSPLGSLKISQNAAVPALHSWEIHSSSSEFCFYWSSEGRAPRVYFQLLKALILIWSASSAFVKAAHLAFNIHAHQTP